MTQAEKTILKLLISPNKEDTNIAFIIANNQNVYIKNLVIKWYNNKKKGTFLKTNQSYLINKLNKELDTIINGIFLTEHLSMGFVIQNHFNRI